MELLKPQRTAPQRHIVIEGGKRPVHRLDEAVVDALGDIPRKQAHLQAGLVAPGLLVKFILALVGAKQGGQRVAVLLVGPVERLKGLFPDAAVSGFQKMDISAVRQRHGLAVFPRDFAKAHVGVVEHGKGLLGSPRHLPRQRKQALLPLGEDVGLLTQNIVEIFPVEGELRAGLLHIADPVAQRQNLGRKIGRCRRKLHPDRGHHADISLIQGVGRVLVALERGIAAHIPGQLLGLLHHLQAAQQHLRVAQLPLKGGQFPGAALELLKRLQKLLVAFKNILRMPQKCGIGLLPGGKALFFSHDALLKLR